MLGQRRGICGFQQTLDNLLEGNLGRAPGRVRAGSGPARARQPTRRDATGPERCAPCIHTSPKTHEGYCDAGRAQAPAREISRGAGETATRVLASRERPQRAVSPRERYRACVSRSLSPLERARETATQDARTHQHTPHTPHRVGRGGGCSLWRASCRHSLALWGDACTIE